MAILFLVAAVLYGERPTMNSEIKFTGVITGTEDMCFRGGSCRLKINDAWILINGGKSMQGEPIGRLIGIDLDVSSFRSNVGKKAEVFAAKKSGDDKNLTLYGDVRYYIKLLDNE